jgi:hypothetical protein
MDRLACQPREDAQMKEQFKGLVHVVIVMRDICPSEVEAIYNVNFVLCERCRHSLTICLICALLQDWNPSRNGDLQRSEKSQLTST